MALIDKDQIRAEIERRMDKHWDLLPDADSPEDDWTHNELCELGAFKELEHLETFIDSLPEQPDKKTILRICKLHKAWSIMAPWENVEDFVMTNWNSENIV